MQRTGQLMRHTHNGVLIDRIEPYRLCTFAHHVIHPSHSRVTDANSI